MHIRVTYTRSLPDIEVGDIIEVLAIDKEDDEYLLIDRDWGGVYDPTPGLYKILSPNYDEKAHRAKNYGWIETDSCEIVEMDNKQASSMLDKEY